MGIRRALYWAFLASIIVMPAWVMFGRTFFGAPLGAALLLFAILTPVFALGIALVVGLTAMRSDVRRDRAVSWSDAGWVGAWLFLFVLYGFFVVVEGSGGAGSALTALAGDGIRSLSASLSTIVGLAIPVFGLYVLYRQARALATDAGRRLKQHAERLQGEAGMMPPRQMDATFEPVDGPQSGQRIILDDEDRD